jgi:signal transduction histidine kinase
MLRSLTKRIIALSIGWIAFALLGTCVLLWWLYHAHMQDHYDARVSTHLEELVAALVLPEGQLQLRRNPTDPRFQRLNSGWYWEILSGGAVLLKSASLGDGKLDLSGVELAEGHRVYRVSGPGGEPLRAQILETYRDRGPGALTLVVTAPQSAIVEEVQHMGFHMLEGFLALGLGLSLAVVIQVRQALKPLTAMRSQISAIKAGTQARLSPDFPGDVQPLVDELNFLLDHNETLLKRARTQLGDLAHAVKNPLTVIRNEARSMENGQGQLIVEQTHLISGHIDHYLSRARMYGRKDAMGFRTSVRSVMQDLAYAVGHIYKERGIEIRLPCVEDRWFRGETQDLEEMAGNLLDNACKWARGVVTVNCATEGDRLQVIVEDDGPGIPDEHYEDVMRRGRKLDESRPGYGQGLGIVDDIAKLYGGSLELGRSALGGLKAALTLPAA